MREALRSLLWIGFVAVFFGFFIATVGLVNRHFGTGQYLVEEVSSGLVSTGCVFMLAGVALMIASCLTAYLIVSNGEDEEPTRYGIVRFEGQQAQVIYPRHHQTEKSD